MVGTGAERELGSGEGAEGAGLVVGVLERLADIGARPEDSHDERLRAGALILASVGIALISFVWVLTYLAFDEPLAGSHGVPGEVQLTERAADRLEGAFELEPRGPIEVKGKGPMQTFLLKGAVESRPPERGATE